MRLSAILFFGKKPHGIKYRGKHRTVKKVSMMDLLKLKWDYQRTEENMLYLRHPYLTPEQSEGHMSEVDKRVTFWKKITEPRIEKFSKHITLPERLIHLKVTEAWE